MATRLFSTKVYPYWIGGAVLAAVALGYAIWQAKLEREGPNELIVPFQTEQRDIAQLYFDRGFGLREQDSVKVPVMPSTGLVELAFPVPRVPLREVRFDPLMSAGKFVVGRPRLETATGRVVAKFPMTAIVARHQIARLTPVGQRIEGETVAAANDPMLTFELGGPLRVGAPRIPWPEVVALLVLAGLAWRSRPPAPADPEV